VSEIEKGREPSYTVDTLRQLRVDYPNDEFFLLIGSDCLPSLPDWHLPEEIAKNATLLVAMRPNGAAGAEPPSYFQTHRVQMPLIALSSTDLRDRVRQGRSIRFLVPRAVECYIETHHLYRQ
jgi:nicotinate-nucleotide adenylyltransferase